MSKVVEISSEVISRVRRALEEYADREKMPSYTDIETSVGVKFRRDQWRQVLDPIYEELRTGGKPDLTAIVVYGSGDLRGYPAYFSDGGKARSRPFNPNNPAQLERWTKEVERVFSSRRNK